jgi:hypothetical protein
LFPGFVVHTWAKQDRGPETDWPLPQKGVD